MTSTNPASAMNSVAQTISTSPTSQPTPSQHTAIAATDQQQTHPVPMTPPKSPASASPRATRVPGSTTTAPEESRAAGAELTQPLVEFEDGEIARDASSHGEASDSDTDVEILMHSVGRMGLPGPGEDGGDDLPAQRPDVSPILPATQVDSQAQAQRQAPAFKLPAPPTMSSLAPPASSTPSSDFSSNAASGVVNSILKSTTPEFRPARLQTVVEQQTPTDSEHPHVAESAQSDDSDANLPPNVYINGLPPHFPETELYALAAPFGEVRSVRSFTRHVGERESGYGFVLFAKLDSAEKCIQSLRRYRNLHPTFSKQVHKIPGTPYAAPKPYPTPHAGIGHEQFGDDPSDVSFKEKMERLHDFTSTNLYIEGLPLSIDEPTLSALVAPHQIKSSRFFQTKLSNPPRIIAFVRLETRAGAEEVIERLHGRMVRGWNDTGSRISVRFADTAEQRELRRQERNVRDGDQSSSRLTIAQAALLNLRGPAMSTTPSQASLSSFPSHGSLSSLPSHGSLSAQRRQPRGPMEESNFTHGNHGLAVDYNLQRKSPNPYHQRRSPNPHQYDHRSGGQPTFRTASEEQHIQLPPPQRDASGGSMAHLLDSLRSSGHSQGGSRFDYREQFPQTLRSSSSSTDLLSAAAAYSSQHSFPESRATQARNGYTPAEEYLLQQANTDAYPEREHSAFRRRLPGSRMQSESKEGASQGLNVGVRGYRAQASTMAFPHRSPALTMDFSPSLSEDDFHSSSARRGYHGSHASYSDDETPNHASQAHIRSSTLPHPPTAAGRQRHAQHSSINIPPSSRGQFGFGLKKNVDRYGEGSPALTQNSPSMVSPSLTYSSRTPATLSPATPFFNTFAGERDGFDGGLIGEKHSQQLSSRAPAIASHREQM
ncbi:hypothetical protein K525DRAFT_258553 [Schizophyllum commune Loenen D]|nr:hypothetical protein K525DRAFT_258553 [Schizophyllum commune Loenen D]